jgi:hypothetical protein
MATNALSPEERVFYRDRLRDARYAAQADAEGFSQVCYAIEALGKRLLGKEESLGHYRVHIKDIATAAPSLSSLPTEYPQFFTHFDALFEIVRRARNDAMHAGSYARHATSAAVEMCIGLEEAVMVGAEPVSKVKDFMVKTPVVAEPWQPVGHARQLVLAHSFSFLPIFRDDEWYLLSEMALVSYLHPMSANKRKSALVCPISEAVAEGLKLLPAQRLGLEDDISKVVADSGVTPYPQLWLVIASGNQLAGVLSPFELM